MLRKVAIVALTVGLGGVVGAGPAGATSSYGFNKPTGIAVNGGHLWIANYGGNSVTETTSAGQWMRTLQGAQYGFSLPSAVVSYQGYVFVVNRGGSVTELNASTGAVVRVVKGAAYDFNYPTTAVIQSSNVWVADYGGKAVTEFSATTGALIRVLTNAKGPYGFNVPDAIAVAGSYLWIVNKTGGSATDANAGSLTEVVASTGAFVRRITASADSLKKPSGIAFDGTHLWVSDAVTSTVTELTSAGALVRVISNTSLDQEYGFAAPTEVVASGLYVYVISPPGGSPMVTQITAATAEGDWYECNTNVPNPEFNDPTGLVVSGNYVWVVSPGDNTLTQLSLPQGGARVNIHT
jgi:hypothetical protein